jgi:hypothetical protein
MASSKKRKPTPSSPRRIYIRPVERDAIDVDKLARALLNIAEQITVEKRSEHAGDDQDTAA